MARLHIHLSDEVRREMDPRDVDAVLDGQAVQPMFECACCLRRGDARNEPANALLWVSPSTKKPAMLGLIHASCGPSEVRLLEEWTAMPLPDKMPEAEPQDRIWLIRMAGADGTDWATLVLQPASTPRISIRRPGSRPQARIPTQRGLGHRCCRRTCHCRLVVRIRSGRLVGLGADDEEQWPAPDPTPPTGAMAPRRHEAPGGLGPRRAARHTG